MVAILRLIAVVFLLGFAMSNARAQGGAQELTPPRIIEFVEATLPEGTVFDQDIEVTLELTIDVDGTVTRADVVDSGGSLFDEAAQAAVLQLRCDPARRDGEPVASIIQYRYVFEAPVLETAGEMRGALLAADDGTVVGVSEVDPDSSFEVVAVVDRPRREATRYTIPREQLTRVPGTRGDAIRVMEILPGVARPPFGLGTLLVRGSASEDSQVFLEGTSVPLLYHFSGLTSFFNSQLLDRIDFVPGNYSARYGRGIGGVVDLGVRDPANDRVHGIVDLNVIDASLMLEGPVGEHFSLGGSFRRSVIDVVFEQVVPSESTDVIAAPVYYDYQVVGSWRPSQRDRVRMMAYGSHDSFRLFFPESIGEDPMLQGATNLRVQFHFGQLEWRHQYSENTEHLIHFQAGPVNAQYNYGRALTVDLDTIQVNARAEWRTRVSSRFTLTAGLDFAGGKYSLNYAGPALTQMDGRGHQGTPGAHSLISLQGERLLARPAVYLEANMRPSDRLLLITGLRADYYQDIDALSVNPRITAIASPSNHLRLKFAAGLFSQPPQFYETDPNTGNPNLDPIHAVHVETGVEGEIGEGFSFSVNGFYKRLFNRVVTSDERERFRSGGEGHIYGAELSLRFQPTDRVPFFGYLSYTLSRSERIDDEGAPNRLFDFDQPHILSVSGVYQFRRGWEVGATFRLASGNPETAVVGAIYNANTDTFLPINGPINSVRGDLFHRLDVRAQKRWTFERFRLALSLDVQNVYNARHREATAYSHDYSETTAVRGLPILPSLSIRGEF